MVSLTISQPLLLCPEITTRVVFHLVMNFVSDKHLSSGLIIASKRCSLVLPLYLQLKWSVHLWGRLQMVQEPTNLFFLKTHRKNSSLSMVCEYHPWPSILSDKPYFKSSLLKASSSPAARFSRKVLGFHNWAFLPSNALLVASWSCGT